MCSIHKPYTHVIVIALMLWLSVMCHKLVLFNGFECQLKLNEIFEILRFLGIYGILKLSFAFLEFQSCRKVLQSQKLTESFSKIGGMSFKNRNKVGCKCYYIYVLFIQFVQ